MDKKTLKKCQQIVSFFHGSHRAGAALRDEIKKFFTGANLKSSVKTHWSTSWDVCEAILYLENNIKCVSIFYFLKFFLLIYYYFFLYFIAIQHLATGRELHKYLEYER